MKKWDKIIIASLLAISFIPQIIFSFVVIKDYDKTYAVVAVDGEVQKRIPLTGQKDTKEYLIKTKYGTNLIKVENEQIAILEANCPDKVCTEPGFVSKPGQSLICLPHRLYVQIEGVVEVENEVDIRAY